MESKRTLRERGICVIIPTYNNVGTIVDVVQRALLQCDDVIVVSDGSTDGTTEKLEEFNKHTENNNHGVGRITLVSYQQNAGKGTALKRGFRKAVEMGFSYAITLDGDGQHFPEDIPLLLRANQLHPFALIVGQRKSLDTMERSGGSKFANKFSNFWFAVQTLHYLPDTQTGYRLYPLKRLSMLNFLTARYESELELMVFASWAGVELVSQPVNVYYPPREERVSHFRPGLDFARITLLNTILCGLAGVYGYPRMLVRWLLSLFRTIYSFLFFLSTMFLLLPIVACYMRIGRLGEGCRLNLHRLMQLAARTAMVMMPGVRYTCRNRGNEGFDRPAIIICNHQSHLDLMPLLMQSPKMIVLTNRWVWNNPLYGYLIHCAEFLPVYNGIDAIKPQIRSLVGRGYSIAIYPEGTRSADCSIGRFHQGAFALAQELGLDIVPLVLYGAGRVLPKTARRLRRGRIHIDIDRRISPADLLGLGETAREQASAMRRYYIRRYGELCNELER